ncbi:MAG: hypothetical protein ACYTE8_00965 [Planctomycetota bacterium]|jgi:predicted RNase H-related nuclease YkuK (DUF458 family)
MMGKLLDDYTALKVEVASLRLKIHQLEHGTYHQRMADLAEELLDHTTTVHLDMGGNHKYGLDNKAHPIVGRMKALKYGDR